MNGISSEIRDIVDSYRGAGEPLRLLIAADAMQRLFIAERIWKGISKVDAAEERIKGDME